MLNFYSPSKPERHCKTAGTLLLIVFVAAPAYGEPVTVSTFHIDGDALVAALSPQRIKSTKYNKVDLKHCEFQGGSAEYNFIQVSCRIRHKRYMSLLFGRTKISDASLRVTAQISPWVDNRNGRLHLQVIDAWTSKGRGFAAIGPVRSHMTSEILDRLNDPIILSIQDYIDSLESSGFPVARIYVYGTEYGLEVRLHHPF